LEFLAKFILFHLDRFADHWFATAAAVFVFQGIFFPATALPDFFVFAHVILYAQWFS